MAQHRESHRRPVPKDVEYMLATRQWSQFQLYGEGEGGTFLATAGLVTAVGLESDGSDDLSFRVRADHVADVAHDGVSWTRIERPIVRTPKEAAMHTVSVLFPAYAIADAKFTANGRLVLLAAHPKEVVLLALFPVGDAGDPSHDFGFTINKLNLTGIETR